MGLSERLLPACLRERERRFVRPAKARPLDGRLFPRSRQAEREQDDRRSVGALHGQDILYNRRMTTKTDAVMDFLDADIAQLKAEGRFVKLRVLTAQHERRGKLQDRVFLVEQLKGDVAKKKANYAALVDERLAWLGSPETVNCAMLVSPERLV